VSPYIIKLKLLITQRLTVNTNVVVMYGVLLFHAMDTYTSVYKCDFR